MVENCFDLDDSLLRPIDAQAEIVHFDGSHFQCFFFIGVCLLREEIAQSRYILGSQSVLTCCLPG